MTRVTRLTGGVFGFLYGFYFPFVIYAGIFLPIFGVYSGWDISPLAPWIAGSIALVAATIILIIRPSIGAGVPVWNLAIILIAYTGKTIFCAYLSMITIFVFKVLRQPRLYLDEENARLGMG